MGFSLIQWGLALLFFSLNLGGVISYAIGSHAIETTLGLSSAQIGSLGGSYFIAYAISQLLLGSLFGLVPSRWLLGGSALLAGLGALVMAQASGYPMALLARVLMGIGFGPAFVGTIYGVSQRFPQQFALMTNLSQSLANLVGACLGLLSGVIPVIAEFRISFHAVFLLLLINAALILAFLKDKKPEGRSTEPPSPAAAGRGATLLMIIGNAQFWWSTLYFMGLFAAYLAFADLWNIQFQTDVFGRSPAIAPVVNAALACGLVLGGILSGLWAGRAGFLLPARVCAWLALLMLIFLGSAVLPGPGAIAALAVLGLAMGAAPLGLTAMKEHLPKPAVASGTSLLLTVVFLAGGLLTPAVGQAVATLPMNAFSTYQVAMHWFIAFAAIAAVASLFLQRGPFRGTNEAKAQANG